MNTLYNTIATRNTVMPTGQSTKQIKVVIADDHVLYRAGVRSALGFQKDVEVMGEADNGEDLLTLLKTVGEIDVILLDIQMPVMDGIAVLPELKRNYPHIKVIMLTMIDDNSVITKLLELGANSFLTKTSDSEIIHDAIKTCFESDYYFNSLTNTALLNSLKQRNFSATQKLEPNEPRLSEKETTILKLMCEEKSTREIAEMVDLSPRTVEAMRDKLKVKTGSRNTAGLIMYAVKHKIIEGEK